MEPIYQLLGPDFPKAEPFFKTEEQARAFNEWWTREVRPEQERLDRERRAMEEEFYRSERRFS
jgi:hypothetical protein